MTKLAVLVRDFAREEDGIALTEYLILLGLFTAAVILAVAAAGSNLATAWESWGNFFTAAGSCNAGANYC